LYRAPPSRPTTNAPLIIRHRFSPSSNENLSPCGVLEDRIMPPSTSPNQAAATTGPYALATGEAAAYRLRLLHRVYGPGTLRVLPDAGLRPGTRVADVGCGPGMVTGLLGALVGPRGQVVGIDASAAQLAKAREQLITVEDRSNVPFVGASATATGL